MDLFLSGCNELYLIGRPLLELVLTFMSTVTSFKQYIFDRYCSIVLLLVHLPAETSTTGGFRPAGTGRSAAHQEVYTYISADVEGAFASSSGVLLGSSRGCFWILVAVLTMLFIPQAPLPRMMR
mmetsp:Transcript_9252/g.22724  ORF Transcript_9252/g.22724 Transcript_9252/m.22724 type:complete len:124 (+) Transcript_9252:767-1138(+)